MTKQLSSLPRKNWPSALGADLEELLGRCQPPVASIEALGSLDAPKHRTATYCVTLADGSQLKARRAWDDKRAQRIAHFLQAVIHLGFPRVLDRHQSALLLDWLPASDNVDPIKPSHLSLAGQLLAHMHCTEIAEPCLYPGDPDVNNVRRRLDQLLAQLLEHDLLTGHEADTIRHAAIPPKESAIGLIHTDFCPENLIVGTHGQMQSIDNESLQLGFLHLDLARCWYRWPLNSHNGGHFLAAYNQIHNDDAFELHFSFWYLYVLLDAAAYRLNSPSGAWQIPIAQLKNYLTNPTSVHPNA